MPSVFDITAATTTVNLDNSRRAEVSFAVTNTSGRSIRGRARVAPEGEASPTWFSIKGEIERDFATAGTQQYTVQLAVPTNVAGGDYIFRLDMVGVDNPDEMYSRGQPVTLRVPGIVVDEGPVEIPPKGYLFSFAGAAIGILAGLALGFMIAFVISILTRGGAQTVVQIIVTAVAWLGSILGIWLALNIRKFEWIRETTVAVAIISLILSIATMGYLFGGGLDRGSIFIVIVLFLVWIIVPGLLARAIILRWKTGQF